MGKSSQYIMNNALLNLFKLKIVMLLFFNISVMEVMCYSSFNVLFSTFIFLYFIH